jgi:hypothetical protein
VSWHTLGREVEEPSMVPHPPRDPPDDPAERAEALITALLAELEPAATLLEFTPALLNHYRFAIAVPVRSARPSS